MEIIITLIFWVALWGPAHKEKKYQENKLRMSGLVLEHTVPLLCLLVEYIALNAMPFVLRHCWLYFIFNVVYAINNFVASVMRDKPVYPIMDWTKAGGIALGVFMPFGFITVFAIMRWINQKKLRYLKYDDMADLIDGK